MYLKKRVPLLRCTEKHAKNAMSQTGIIFLYRPRNVRNRSRKAVLTRHFQAGSTRTYHLSAMETSGERDLQERRIGPTVSKDKWINHAKNKLSRGYVLIVGTERKTANFHSKEKGYEACSWQVARQLIKDGAVRKVREHHLGDVYELIEPVPPLSRSSVKQPQRSDDEFEALLNELEEGSKDESEAETAD